MAFLADISIITLSNQCELSHKAVVLTDLFRYLHLQQAPRPFLKARARLDTLP